VGNHLVIPYTSSYKAQLVPPPYNSAVAWLEVGGQKMTEYEKAVQAMKWLNRNTDYRANNITGDFPHPQSYKKYVGGMFELSKFSTKESLGIITGDDLIAVALREGWKDE
jgi:hypothetical protein